MMFVATELDGVGSHWTPSEAEWAEFYKAVAPFDSIDRITPDRLIAQVNGSYKNGDAFWARVYICDAMSRVVIVASRNDGDLRAYVGGTVNDVIAVLKKHDVVDVSMKGNGDVDVYESPIESGNGFDWDKWKWTGEECAK